MFLKLLLVTAPRLTTVDGFLVLVRLVSVDPEPVTAVARVTVYEFSPVSLSLRPS